jgi:hypothetical protein
MQATGGEKPFCKCTGYTLFKEEQFKLLREAEEKGTPRLTEKEEQELSNATKSSNHVITACRWEELPDKRKKELAEKAREINKKTYEERKRHKLLGIYTHYFDVIKRYLLEPAGADEIQLQYEWDGGWCITALARPEWGDNTRRVIGFPLKLLLPGEQENCDSDY